MNRKTRTRFNTNIQHASRRHEQPPLSARQAGGSQVAIPGYNYAPDAGAGSRTFADAGGTWRAALLGSVAAGAILVGVARGAKAGPDACSVAGDVVTCQGDQSDGIANYASPAVQTLNVNSLTADITPAAGPGISLDSTGAGSVTIDAQLGDYAIIAPGDGIFGRATVGTNFVDITASGDITSTGADGIDARAVLGPVTIDSTGDITAYSRGINAETDGDITIDSAGNISAGLDGIRADSHEGDITITSTGDITSTTEDGITADASYGSVTITSTGNITADAGRGIYAFAENDVTVTSAGDITADGNGIEAFSFVDGNVAVTSTGDISAGAGGIRAYSFEGDNITVVSEGDITADYGAGISATAGLDGGSVSIASTGDITAESGHGLYASGRDSVTVTSTGNITSEFEGIFAFTSSYSEALSVVSVGDISSAARAGIKASGREGSVSVSSEGAITAASQGIDASGDGDVSVMSAGDITSSFEGIRARSFGSGLVEVTSTGDIVSSNSSGIYAYAYDGSVSVASIGDISVGYRGIEAIVDQGDGDITISSEGDITADEEGIRAQADDGDITITSIGDIDAGKGGIEAFTQSAAVTIDSTGDITGGSDGIYVISSGAVTIASAGNVTAYGDDAIDVDGGAGDVIVTSSGNISADDDGFDISTTSGSITVTSTGDISADDKGIEVETYGGSITITSTGNITAEDEGIDAQVYGDGDITIASAGDIVSEDDDGIDVSSDGYGNLTITGAGDITADDSGIEVDTYGGNINITSTGNITAGSYGIDATSTYYGDITIVSTGDIVVDGDYAGLHARTSGSVTIESTGDIGSGDVSPYFGVYVREAASADVTLRGGKVYGSQYGVYFDGTITSSLKNYAELSGGVFAVFSNSGDNTIENFGLITGDVDLGDGTNAFFNRADGEFRPGGTVDLGGGVLTNEGVLSPGGTEAVQTTALTGDLVQTADGNFVVDVDESGDGVDRLTISGTADFAGLVTPNLIDLQSETGQFIIAEASSVTLSGAEAADQGLIDFGLTTLAGETQLALTFEQRSLFDLVSGPLTRNERAVANYLEAVGLANPSPGVIEAINNLFDLPDEASIVAALNQLSPEHYLAQAMGTWFASAAFVRGAMSCPEPGAAGALVREGQCYWARIEGRRLDWDRTRDNIGGDETAWSLSTGLQAWIGEGWLGGGALSYERSDIDSGNGASADGHRFQSALTLKRDWQDVSLGAAVFAGYGDFDTDRPLGLAMPGAVASGDQDIFISGAHLRLSQTHDRGGWYLRPMVDLNLTYLSYGDLRESGAGDIGLSIQDEEEWLFSASPALEIGGAQQLADGTVIQPYARVGFTWLSDDSLALSAGFVEGAEGIGPFTVAADFDDLFADLSAGIVAQSPDGVSLRAGYHGKFGEDVEQHSGSVKLGVRF